MRQTVGAYSGNVSPIQDQVNNQQLVHNVGDPWRLFHSSLTVTTGNRNPGENSVSNEKLIERNQLEKLNTNKTDNIHTCLDVKVLT